MDYIPAIAVYVVNNTYFNKHIAYINYYFLHNDRYLEFYYRLGLPISGASGTGSHE